MKTHLKVIFIACLLGPLVSLGQVSNNHQKIELGRQTPDGKVQISTIEFDIVEDSARALVSFETIPPYRNSQNKYVVFDQTRVTISPNREWNQYSGGHFFLGKSLISANLSFKISDQDPDNSFALLDSISRDTLFKKQFGNADIKGLDSDQFGSGFLISRAFDGAEEALSVDTVIVLYNTSKEVLFLEAFYAGGTHSLEIPPADSLKPGSDSLKLSLPIPVEEKLQGDTTFSVTLKNKRFPEISYDFEVKVKWETKSTNPLAQFLAFFNTSPVHQAFVFVFIILLIALPSLLLTIARNRKNNRKIKSLKSALKKIKDLDGSKDKKEKEIQGPSPTPEPKADARAPANPESELQVVLTVLEELKGSLLPDNPEENEKKPSKKGKDKRENQVGYDRQFSDLKNLIGKLPDANKVEASVRNQNQQLAAQLKGLPNSISQDLIQVLSDKKLIPTSEDSQKVAWFDEIQKLVKAKASAQVVPAVTELGQATGGEDTLSVLWSTGLLQYEDAINEIESLLKDNQYWLASQHRIQRTMLDQIEDLDYVVKQIKQSSVQATLTDLARLSHWHIPHTNVTEDALRDCLGCLQSAQGQLRFAFDLMAMP